MGPRLVHLRRGDVRPRLRTLGLTGPHPVVAVFGTTSDLPPELSASLAPVFRALLQAAADNDALVVTGGTDAGVFHVLGVSAVGVQPAPILIGVAPDGRVQDNSSTGNDPDRATLEPNHRVTVLVPGDEWGDETAALSQLVAAVSTDLPAVGVLVGGGDVSRLELREHLARGRTVVVLRGSGRLADEVADGSLGDRPDADLAALAAAGDIRVVDLAAGPVAMARQLDVLLGPPARRGMRARVPALLALPRWRARPQPVASLIGRDPPQEYPALLPALQDADAIVLPAMRDCDAIALREQNRHRWYVTLGLIGGLLTTTFGAVQSWLVSLAWPGVAVATIGAATSGLLTISRRQGSLDAYVLARTRAERLRSLYFEYLVSGPPGDDAGYRLARARLREETARRRYGLPPAAAPAPEAAGAPAASGPDDLTGDPDGAWREQFLDLYRRHRLDEQARWYADRSAEYESALRTTVTVSALLLVLSAFFGALGTADEARRSGWAVCAATCGAMAAAVNTYEAMSGFGRLSRQYAETVAGLRLADARTTGAESLDSPGLRRFVTETERLVLGEVTSWSVHLRQAEQRTEPGDATNH